MNVFLSKLIIIFVWLKTWITVCSHSCISFRESRVKGSRLWKKLRTHLNWKQIKAICGGLFLMVFIHFKLFWISSKLSHEHKTGINNSNAQHVILQRKWFLELPEFFISKLWKGIEKVEQKMLRIYFPRSARTKLHWDNHCRCYKLSKHSEEQNFAFRYLIRTFQNEILYQLKLAELLKLFYWNWWMH